jgi:hypothetical protein
VWPWACYALPCAQGRRRLLTARRGAAQALVFANEAVEGWEAGTVASRCAAQEAAKQAAEFSQLAHKLMRAVYKAK